MGDISAEPSMEDILSSIKRIIAEEAEPARPRRAMGAARAAPVSTRAPASMSFADDDADDAVLELSDPIVPEEPTPEPTPPAAAPAAVREPSAAPAAAPDPAAPSAAKVSAATVEAARGALDSLSRLVVKPDQPGSDTLEGLVREMLRPMLAQWLDQHLPALVEQMVAREIARISSAAE